MKVKLNWLRELVDLEGISSKEIIDKISLYSIEVESVTHAVEGTNVVVGHVLDCIPHPDSDHLSICQVDAKEEVLQIVCGAPNVKKGLYVLVAKIGAVLPGDFKIKKSKIRGVESSGMICSLQELGLDKKYIGADYQTGIYYFKEEVAVGSDALVALALEDEIVELGLTPNRGDLLSMIGVAYEVSAIMNRPLKEDAFTFSEGKSLKADKLQVKMETSGCNYYSATLLKNIQIKPSPTWLISRLIAFGIRPINNVVDVTNYILALYGQPLHAFDFQKLGSYVTIRNAIKKEEIVTIDGERRVLQETDIVIANKDKAVAVAGVMGGFDTEVESNTTDIILEAAVFSPDAVRKTSQRLGLRSDSSMRFEKGLDSNRTKKATAHAIYLLEKLASAKTKEQVEVGNVIIDDTFIDIEEFDVKKYLGISISLDQMKQIFSQLHFKVASKKEILTVGVPNRRSDIKIKADLIEEIVRIHGYENLPATLPFSNLSGMLTTKQKKRRQIRTFLSSIGFHEVVNYSLTSKEENKLFSMSHIEGGEDISLLMPLSNERNVLRKSLVMNLVENAVYNAARKQKDLFLFELGRIYFELNGEHKEEERLAMLLSGVYASTLWKGESEKVDFFTSKGILDSLSKQLNIHLDYQLPEEDMTELHPKRSAILTYQNEKIGFIGELHPKYAQEKGVKDVYVIELKLDMILKLEDTVTKYETISKTLDMERDIALVVNQNILAGDLVKTAKLVDQKMLKEVKIFDVYVGENVEQHEKSIAMKLIFSSNEPLTEEVVTNKVNKVVAELGKKFDAKLRA